MKKTKVIIPALGMLLLSTAASVTGTVAWFAANASIQANGMRITANTDSSFLIVGTSNVLATVQAANNTTADLSASNAQVSPIAHDTIANTTDANATDVSNLKEYQLASDNSKKITIDAYNALDAEGKALYEAVNANGTNWYYQVADAVTASTSTKQKNYLETLDEHYILHTTIYVTMSIGSNDASNLKVKAASFTMTSVKDGAQESMNPVRVLVTSATASVEFSARNPSAGLPSDVVLATTVTPAALVPIDIYVYYDGNDADVYTNNAANLEGATVDLTLDVGRQ